MRNTNKAHKQANKKNKQTSDLAQSMHEVWTTAVTRALGAQHRHTNMQWCNTHKHIKLWWCNEHSISL